MKTIIAPTDFSPTSLNAVDYALELACSINASLYLIHVYQLPITVSEIPVSAEEIEAVQKDAEEQMKHLKKEVIKKAGGKIKVYSRVTIGTILHEVEDLCQSLKSYAVVMGTQGTGAVKRFSLGSNTIAAVRHLSCPLIAVPPKTKFTGIKKIGLACDMQKVINTIPAREIKQFVEEFKAELHVIYINSEGDPLHMPETVEESAYLQEMLEKLHPVYHTLNNPNIEDTISNYAERHHLDLLIVIPKKHGLLEALFHKSQSKKLILHTQVPVMAV